MIEFGSMLAAGLDLSSQSLSVVVVDENGRIVYEKSLEFDSEFAHYGTMNGALFPEGNTGSTVVSPTLMWVEALDTLFGIMKQEFPLERISSISASAQQHATVYWNSHKFPKALLSPLDYSNEATPTFFFSIPLSPIWRDHSTTKECKNMEKQKNPLWWRQITGSTPYERFSGAQIGKIIYQNKEGYKQTKAISLASSFLTSMLIGALAPIDFSDASGMNLFDVTKRIWSREAVAVIAGCDDSRSCEVNVLLEKLGPVCPPWTVVGMMNDVYCERFGFARNCNVVSSSGDNPCSIVACGKKGDIIISLGTSDTLIASGISYENINHLHTTNTMRNGHLFVDPIEENSLMGLLCFKNGSLARERLLTSIKQSKNWDYFSKSLSETSPGNEGRIGIFYYEAEITPHLPASVRRWYNGISQEEPFDPTIEVRAIIESQFLLMKIYATNIGVFPPTGARRIIATGGASKNKAMLQVLSDITNEPVYCLETPGSAALGAAFRSQYATRASFSPQVPVTLVCSPNEACQAIYASMEQEIRELQMKVEQKQ